MVTSASGTVVSGVEWLYSVVVFAAASGQVTRESTLCRCVNASSRHGHSAPPHLPKAYQVETRCRCRAPPPGSPRCFRHAIHPCCSPGILRESYKLPRTSPFQPEKGPIGFVKPERLKPLKTCEGGHVRCLSYTINPAE